MSLDLTNEINEMISSANMREEQVLDLIRDMIRSAYKRKYGTDENVQIEFDDTNRLMDVYQIKKVVREEEWYNEHTEISIDDAKDLVEDVEIGDVISIPLDPKTFESSSVQSAKQRGQQIVREFTNDRVYANAKSLENKLIFGKLTKRKESGEYTVDIKLDKADVVFPLRGQSPRETYQDGEQMKFLVERVEKADAQETNRKKRKGPSQVRVVLSRSSRDFIKALLDNEVPEISNGDVEIVAIARQAGVRTKIAVDTKKIDVDPVGAVVGQKGSRIQTIMNECEGEKIDVIRYSSDPLAFVANALIPAQVERVVTIDPQSRHVVAIVDDNQLGFAIGQGGVNVKLAKMLTDWNIDVKTQAQFAEMEINQKIIEDANALFKNEDEEDVRLSNEDLGIAPDDTPLDDIGLDEDLVAKLHNLDIWSVEEFFELGEEELKESGLTEDEINTVRNSVVFEEDDDYTFTCPSCGAEVPSGTAVCPNCGAEFEFE